MRDFRADDFRFRLFGLLAPLLLASAWLGAAPAAAQQAAPIELVPPVDAPSASSSAPAPGTAPPEVTPTTAPAPAPLPAPAMSAPPQPAPPAAPPQTPAPADNTIQVSPLSTVDASWLGMLSEGQGGFPHAMWNGTSRALVAADLPQLQPVSSPVLQDLTRRLLLSDAAAPSGENPPGGASLVDLRFDRLFVFGFVEPALELLRNLPDSMVSESTDRIGIELRFANNDVTGACNDVSAKIIRYQGVWWDRALIACQALNGDNAKASLGQSLLADQKVPRDPGFDALIDRLGGRPVKITQLNDATPMKLALLAAAKQNLPSNAVANADLAALYGWAMNAKLPPEQRLPAAERGEYYGAVTPEDLAALYDQIPIKPAERAAIVQSKVMKPPSDTRGRALFYQIAHTEDDVATRRGAITALLADAKKRGAFKASALLLGAVLSGITIDGSTSDFDADAARVLLVAGTSDNALPWVEAVQSKPLRLLARFAAGGPPLPGDAQLLQDALAELAARNPAAAPRQADLLKALTATLEAPVLSPATAPAASGAHLGETVLTTRLTSVSGDQLTQDPAALSSAVAGLRAVGLDKEARRLAIEAAIDAGI
jgi:hypothetical protein